jgi:hypothetical protein
MPSGYEAFISYRRGDGAGIARWIRNRLQRYTLPAPVVAMLSPEKRELHRRKPRIYLDRAYEKPHADFLQEKILPALDAAERLIVISTPSVFDTIRGADGVDAPNWLVQEVEHFLAGRSADQPPRPIDLVIGPKGSIERFPGRLSERARWDWIDLRAFNGWRALGFSEALDAGFTKLAAAIYDVPDAALPLMRQEERRRRRRLVLGISAAAAGVVAALGVLGSGWWAETRARQAVDFERRLIVARGLIDTGDVAKAVETLAGLARLDNPDHGLEARQLLAAWAAHLATASDRLREVPDRRVFRWQGRNHLRDGAGLRLSFEGPPTLESAVAHQGAWLVTFDADRRLRVRDPGRGGAPLLQTGELDATTGTISEVLDGRMILFEASMLSLQSDEEAGDAQDVGGKLAVLLDPASGAYAVQTDPGGGGPIDATCDRLQLSGGEITLFPGQQLAGPNARLAVSAAAGRGFRWDLTALEVTAVAASDPPAASASGPTPGCAPRVVADLPRTRDPAPLLDRLQFPSPLAEATLWTATGTLPDPAPGLDLCPMAIEVDGAPAADSASPPCYDATRATSVEPGSAGTLGMILRQSETTPEVKDLGDTRRLVVTAVLGNQSYGIASCAIEADRSLGRCLVASPTARSRMAFRLSNQFLVINGPEVHAGMFQLIDMHALRSMQVDPPPMERLADVAFAPDGTRMVALTATGEVWLYAVDRGRAAATIAARYDFGGHGGALEAPEAVTAAADAAAGAAPDLPDQFDAVSFVGTDRLLLAGQRGGVVLADAASGRPLWARPAPRLPGAGPLHLAVGEEAGIIVLHDDRSAQLLTARSGIPLSGPIDLARLAQAGQRADASGVSPAVGVQFGDAGQPRLTFRQVIVDPQDPWNGGLPTEADIARRTGVDESGRNLPLGQLLR